MCNSVGAKVMRDHDGRPAVRDPTFLAEANLIPKQRADRVMPGAQMAGATLTGRLPDPSVPVTIYSEAVANNTYGGAVYVSRSERGQPDALRTHVGRIPTGCQQLAILAARVCLPTQAQKAQQPKAFSHCTVLIF